MPSLPGAVKADLFPGLPPRPPAGPLPEVTATALPAIDAHFWDWALWLGAKRQHGRDALVAALAAVTTARRHAFPPGPGRITACIA